MTWKEQHEEQERLTRFVAYRASSTSVVTARSSVSRTANPSLFSSSARTPVALHGPFSSDVNTRRVSLRYAPQPLHSRTIRRRKIQSSPGPLGSKPLTPEQEVAKKRTRRTVKQQRGIVGASLDVIKERKSQRPEARAAARQQAIAAGKLKKTDAESVKKAEKAKGAAKAGGASISKVSKQGAKGAPMKVAAKSR